MGSLTDHWTIRAQEKAGWVKGITVIVRADQPDEALKRFNELFANPSGLEITSMEKNS